MKNLYTHFFYCIFFIALFFMNSFNSNAQDIRIYKSVNISIESSACAEKMDEVAILKKEFPSTKFVLNLEKKILEIINEGEVNYYSFTLNDSNITLKEYRSDKTSIGNFIGSNDKYLLKIKDHNDDCFSYVITFDK